MAEHTATDAVARVALGTAAGYLLLLAAMFVALFLVPYLVFRFV